MADINPVMRPGDWRRRRRVIYGALLFCAGGVAFALAWPGDATGAPVRGQIAMALVGAATAILGSYVFGAVWDDHNARRDAPDAKP